MLKITESFRFLSLMVAIALSLSMAAPAFCQIDVAVDQAEGWLLTQQNLDGSLGAITELQPVDSAATIVALQGRPASTSALAAAAGYLDGVAEQNTHFRSRRAVALSAAGLDASTLLATLGGFRNGSGMGAFGSHQANVLDTAFAVQALVLEESTYLLDIVTLLDDLQASQQLDGGWGFEIDSPSEAYYSAEVLQALADVDQLAISDAVLATASAYLAGRQPSGPGCLACGTSKREFLDFNPGRPTAALEVEKCYEV